MEMKPTILYLEERDLTRRFRSEHGNDFSKTDIYSFSIHHQLFFSHSVIIFESNDATYKKILKNRYGPEGLIK